MLHLQLFSSFFYLSVGDLESCTTSQAGTPATQTSESIAGCS